MTTAEFIKKTYGTRSTRERRCSSVITDYNGNVYSYGSHYPLLFKVGGLDLVNTTGYSNTTAKHIAWAHKATDYTAISVELNGLRNPEDFTLEDMRKILFKMHTEVTDQMLAKKRKDTWVYTNLQQRASAIVRDLQAVTEAM